MAGGERQLPWRADLSKFPATQADHLDPYCAMQQSRRACDNSQGKRHLEDPSDRSTRMVTAVWLQVEHLVMPWLPYLLKLSPLNALGRAAFAFDVRHCIIHCRQLNKLF